MAVTKRPLGKSGISVAPLALGGNVFGWTADEAASFEILDAFVDAGFNLVDTADVYSKWAPGNQGGESETILGKWFRHSGNRGRVVLATKVGMDLPPEEPGLAKAYILETVEKSLARLQTDYIDLYQSHKDDPHTPLEETLSAYDLLIKQGKIRTIGASNYTAARLQESLDVSHRLELPHYQCLQPHYNLCERALYEAELEGVCERAGLGVIPYYSLASGFLTGKYRTEADLAQSPRGASVKKYLNERGLKILAALDEVARQQNSTPAGIALAWLIARPSITAPIASATSVEQLEALVAAAELELAPEQIEKLNAASA
ncbi:MAG: aldo/keto reductase [Planctomycetaceae bacterium]|nr:aldo/keto reductase [Planctomycetaceae bacterium]